jgi:multidrug resistance efflux pump
MMRKRQRGKVVKWLLWITGILTLTIVALGLIEIDDIIIAQGIVEPGQKIYIDSPMSRVVHRIYALPGDTVRAHQPVAQLYDGDLRAAVAAAEKEVKREMANLAAANAQLALLQENPIEERKIAESRVQQARISLTAREQELKRAKQLFFGERLWSQEDFERAQTNYDLAHANLQVAIESLNLVKRGPSPAELQKAEATVQQTEAALEKAQQHLHAAREALELATLRSPVDGIVARQDLYPGMQASQGGIVLIVAGLEEGTVIGAWMPETNAWKVQVGHPVEILSNLFTDREGFVGEGEVAEIYGYALHENNLRTFGLEVAVKKTPIPLRYGSTADLRIIVGRRSILQTLLSLENPEAVESSSGAILQKKSTTPTADSLQSP